MVQYVAPNLSRASNVIWCVVSAGLVWSFISTNALAPCYSWYICLLHVLIVQSTSCVVIWSRSSTSTWKGIASSHISLERTNRWNLCRLNCSYGGDVVTMIVVIKDSSASIAPSSRDKTACISIDKFETSKLQKFNVLFCCIIMPKVDKKIEHS